MILAELTESTFLDELPWPLRLATRVALDTTEGDIGRGWKSSWRWWWETGAFWLESVHITGGRRPSADHKGRQSGVCRRAGKVMDVPFLTIVSLPSVYWTIRTCDHIGDLIFSFNSPYLASLASVRTWSPRALRDSDYACRCHFQSFERSPRRMKTKKDWLAMQSITSLV